MVAKPKRRIVNIGQEYREMPEIGLAVDPGPIAQRLQQEFIPAFEDTRLCTDTLAEMITNGVLLVLEEMAKQGQEAGAGYIMIQVPRAEEVPEEDDEPDGRELFW